MEQHIQALKKQLEVEALVTDTIRKHLQVK